MKQSALRLLKVEDTNYNEHYTRRNAEQVKLRKSSLLLCLETVVILSIAKQERFKANQTIFLLAVC
jgi:hypothetical protein